MKRTPQDDPSRHTGFPDDIRAFRQALQLSLDRMGHGAQKEIAAKAERSPTYLNDIVRGRTNGSLALRQRIAAALGLEYEAMLELGREALRQATESGTVVCRDTEFMTVPLVRARLSGGAGSFETEDDVVGYYAFRSDFLRRKGAADSMVLFQVAGHSMSPLLENGDTVMVDQSQNEVISGHIYALGIEDTVVVKRIEIEPGAMVLKSENPEYDTHRIPLHENANLRVIGRVVWSAREF